MTKYWKIQERLPFLVYISLLIVIGLLISYFPIIDKIWMGYLIAGGVIFLSFKWELVEE